VVAVAGLLGSEVAMAGADTTFNTALTAFTGFLEGSGGKIITVLSLAGGIVGLASGRFSLGQVAIPVGVGVGSRHGRADRHRRGHRDDLIQPFRPPRPGLAVGG
jgi:conjugal transfer pilus assembly protein TraA